MSDRRDARDFDLPKDEPQFIRIAKYGQDKCIGRGHALIFDEEHQMAVMLLDCGNSTAVTRLR